MGTDRLVKASERLANPITAGSIHFLQHFFGLLPRGVQRTLLERSAASTPYMGFVVDPYAFFMFYEVADEQRAANLLPDGFRLARTSVFAGDEPACHAVISFFRVHTSAFIGARAEFYLLATDERTGLLSWVIVDYLSDTVSYDRAGGLRAPSAPGAVVTTTADGRVLVDLCDTCGARAISFAASLDGADMRSLDQRLWVEGNLSVAYGPELSPDDPAVFSLTFQPDEMTRALDVPVADLALRRMTWHADLLEALPVRLACFPFAQHLLSDSPGTSSAYASPSELERAVESLDVEALPVFSTASTRRGIMVGTVLSVAITAALAVALVMT